MREDSDCSPQKACVKLTIYLVKGGFLSLLVRSIRET